MKIIGWVLLKRLALWAKDNKVLSEIQYGQNHKYAALNVPQWPTNISLCADDMALYIRDSDINLSPILREYIQFGQHSGLHINWANPPLFH